MGNMASCFAVGMVVKDKVETCIKLIRSDGAFQILHKPLCAAQIMKESPQHLICHSASFYIGHKTPTLSRNELLKAGNKYFLLPQHFFHSPLSLLSLASLISPPAPSKAPPTSRACLSALLRSIERASVFCQPFEIQKSDIGGGLRIRVCLEFISNLLEDGRVSADQRGHSVGGDRSAGDELGGLCNTRELQKEYAQLVKSRDQCWRPKLGTIKEKEKKIDGFKRLFKITRLGLINS